MKRKTFLSGVVLFVILGLAFPGFALDRATLRLDWVRFRLQPVVEI